MTPAGCLLAAAVALAPSPAGEAVGLDAFLARWGLTASDRGALDAGEVVARSLPVRDAKDVAAVAAVRVAVSKRRLLEWLQDVPARGGESVIAAGEITRPGDAADVAGLVVAAPQAAELRGCRYGDCEMKLPAEAIAQLAALRGPRREVTSDVASRVLRDVLLRAAQDWRREGADGLPTYADGPRPVHVRDALQGLLALAPDLLAGLPALDVPLAPEGMAGRLVWSQERLWKRIVISLDHEVLAEPSPAEAVLVATRVFANHYFEGALFVTSVRETAAGCYVVFLTLSRSDHEGTGFTRLERALVDMLVRRKLRRQWQDARERLQAPRG